MVKCTKVFERLDDLWISNHSNIKIWLFSRDSRFDYLLIKIDTPVTLKKDKNYMHSLFYTK